MRQPALAFRSDAFRRQASDRDAAYGVGSARSAPFQRARPHRAACGRSRTAAGKPRSRMSCSLLEPGARVHRGGSRRKIEHRCCAPECATLFYIRSRVVRSASNPAGLLACQRPRRLPGAFARAGSLIAVAFGPLAVTSLPSRAARTTTSQAMLQRPLLRGWQRAALPTSWASACGVISRPAVQVRCRRVRVSRTLSLAARVDQAFDR